MDITNSGTINSAQAVSRGSGGRMKFVVGGLLILAAIVYLIWTSATANAEYFMTVDEVQSQGAALVGRQLRVSGAVVGETIQYDSDKLVLTFTVANTPGNQAEIDAQGGLAAVLHNAVTDPSRSRMSVVYSGVMPDLLKNEAQAIMTGRMGEDGVFHAEELLLKCPSRYEEAVPEQSAANP
jgi:cytochrome c-type biogenesis protein CcmE